VHDLIKGESLIILDRCERQRLVQMICSYLLQTAFTSSTVHHKVRHSVYVHLWALLMCSNILFLQDNFKKKC